MNRMLMFFSSSLNAWGVENRQCCYKIDQNNAPNLKKRETREPKQLCTVLFSPTDLQRCCCCHWEKIKGDTKLLTRRNQKNTLRRGAVFENNGVRQDVTGITTAHSFLYPLRSNANRLSKQINIHATLKETALKLTFRWKWHSWTFQARDHGGVGGIKNCIHQSHFACPKEGQKKILGRPPPPSPH